MAMTEHYDTNSGNTEAQVKANTVQISRTIDVVLTPIDKLSLLFHMLIITTIETLKYAV